MGCTLSKHMLGSKFKNFHRSFILTLSTHVSGFTLHTVIWFKLSKHMLGSIFWNFTGFNFFHAYTLHICFSVHSPNSFLSTPSKQMFGVRSPYSCIAYTLQQMLHFKILVFFSLISLFSCLHSQHMLITLQTVFASTLQADVWFTHSKHMLGFFFF